ncbi:MAG: sulfur carrier protein ThiS [Chlorobi bacterium]|nr:sulfur carrier protein ThiS [Chlorobiota bacterium]
MEIVLNNRKEKIPFDTISVAELIKYKNFTFKMLVTKINGNLVQKDKRDESFIKNGDEVMILHLIAGG